MKTREEAKTLPEWERQMLLSQLNVYGKKVPARDYSLETRLSQKLWTKTCRITDSEGLQHEVIHITDLKEVIQEVTGWMI